MISYQLQLDYALHPGWMAPFVEGLRDGQAVARSCGVCSRVSFPPVRICDCGEADGTWTTLTGTAEVTLRTTGSDGQFALVRFEGADTSSVVRLQDNVEGHGALRASEGDVPKMILGPVTYEGVS